MIREVSSMTARQNFGELLNEVKYRHDKVLITKAGRPVAALIDIELFEKIRKLKNQFEALTADLGKTYKGTDKETAQKEINEAIKRVRGK